MKGKVFLQVKERSGRLEQVFVIPPISVFDVKSGRWKKRKKLWQAINNKRLEINSKKGI